MRVKVKFLGMAFFKSLAKDHGVRFFEPVGKALARNKMKNVEPRETRLMSGRCVMN